MWLVSTLSNRNNALSQRYVLGLISHDFWACILRLPFGTFGVIVEAQVQNGGQEIGQSAAARGRYDCADISFT